MKRLLCFMTTLTIVILSLSGCWWYKSYIGKRPCDQPNTKWISEDEQIYFWTDEHNYVSGKMLIGDETIDIHVRIGPATDIYISRLDSVKPSEEGSNGPVSEVSLEHWIGNFNQKDQFTATVKRTTYFHADDKISFYRVDDDLSTPEYALFQPTDSVNESVNE